MKKILLAICWQFHRITGLDTGFPYPYDRGYEEPEDCWVSKYPIGEND